MIKNYFYLLGLFASATAIKFFDLRYEMIDLGKVADSMLAIAVSYFIFKLVFEGAVSGKIKNLKTRYSFRKTVQTLFVMVSFLLIIRIWVVDPQALIVAYGLVAAGVAISLQDVFKNFAGGVVIFMTGIYRVGDRIEINGKFGDVIDIGLFYTSLLEIREWVGGDQATGRITLVPNAQVLNSMVDNYTKDHDFIWDELSLPITYRSDWRKAALIMIDVVKRKTFEATASAERQIAQLEEKYYLSKRNIEPAVFIHPTDNWIMLNVRYVVAARERRIMQNELFLSVMADFDKEKDIKIASETITISNP